MTDREQNGRRIQRRGKKTLMREKKDRMKESQAEEGAHRGNDMTERGKLHITPAISCFISLMLLKTVELTIHIRNQIQLHICLYTDIQIQICIIPRNVKKNQLNGFQFKLQLFHMINTVIMSGWPAPCAVAYYDWIHGPLNLPVYRERDLFTQ